MIIREAAREDDEILLRHYRALWESYDVDDVNIRADAETTVSDFIRDGRERFQMAAFLAELDGKVVGSVACQLQQLPYPDVVVPAFRQHGYIWSVFVEPAARRRGVARALVIRAVEYLRSIGCTKAVLNSSDAGEALYRQIGFETANEMRLDL
jgi:ribosomal protein S18 acetylase RimI-like enzyme